MNLVRTAVVALPAVSLGGCTSLRHGGSDHARRGDSSSLVDFLCPDGSIPDKPSEALPYLELPIRVGIAFVPASGGADLSQLLLLAGLLLCRRSIGCDRNVNG